MIRDDLAEAVRSALVALAVEPLPEQVAMERPANRDHGDWSSNVALASAKKAGRNPRELATQLVDHLNGDLPAHVESVEIAGPGFVNFRLAPTWLHDVLAEVVTQGESGYAAPDVGGGRAVNVEFVSANPTGPVHAGHARGAAHGDSVARLLARTGHKVTREFYINDRGVQMQLYGASLAARKAGEEPPEGGYQGEYITDWAAGMPDGVDPVAWGEDRALADQREVLSAFGVDFDVWYRELSLVEAGLIDEALADLRERGVVYEADGATWLRSTDFGDDKDRVLVKSDGELTYLMPDIAYHRDKFSRADQLINIWGADHHGYVARMKAAMAALGPGKRPKVTVTLNGYTYRSTVAVMGGAFLLPLAKVHREASGVRDGQTLKVTLALDTAPREVDVPADLASALKKAKVLAAFEAKSFTQRKEWVRGVEEAKAAETRARRIAKVVDALAG